jgi:hypothetical protein
MRRLGSIPLASNVEAFDTSNDDVDRVLKNVSWGRFNDPITTSPSRVNPEFGPARGHKQIMS